MWMLQVFNACIPFHTGMQVLNQTFIRQNRILVMQVSVLVISWIRNLNLVNTCLLIYITVFQFISYIQCSFLLLATVSIFLMLVASSFDFYNKNYFAIYCFIQVDAVQENMFMKSSFKCEKSTHRNDSSTSPALQFENIK